MGQFVSHSTRYVGDMNGTITQYSGCCFSQGLLRNSDEIMMSLLRYLIGSDKVE